jgi:hypothetical protein
MTETKNYNSIQNLKVISQYILCGLLFLLSFQTYFDDNKLLSSIFFLICGIYILPFLSLKLKTIVPFLNDWIYRRLIFIILLSIALYLKQ